MVAVPGNPHSKRVVAKDMPAESGWHWLWQQSNFIALMDRSGHRSVERYHGGLIKDFTCCKAKAVGICDGLSPRSK